MAYKTGRQRTITYITTVNGTAQGGFGNGLDVDAPGPVVNGQMSFACGFAEFEVIPRFGGYAVDPTALFGTTPYVFQGIIALRAGLFGALHATTPYVATSTTIAPGGAGHLSCTFSGTVTMSIDMEEWAAISYDALPSGGTVAVQQLVDAPPFARVVLYELPRPSGVASITANLGGATYSETHVLTGTEITVFDYGCGSNSPTYGLIYLGCQGTSATWSCTTTFQGAALNIPISYSCSEGSHTSGNSLTVNAGYVRSIWPGVWPSKSYQLNGRINALDQAYPDNLSVDLTDHGVSIVQGTPPTPVTSSIVASNGLYSSSYQQQKYDIYSNFTGDSRHTLTEWYPLTQQINAASLSALGELTANNRLSIRGWVWDALAVSKSANQPIDTTPSAANYMAGANTTLAGTGAAPLAVTVNAAVTKGSFTSTLAQSPFVLRGTAWSGVDLSGYRYLTLRLNHNSGVASAFSVTIGGKVYSNDNAGNVLMTTLVGSALPDVIIDLCAPDGTATDIDATDTQWPLAAGYVTASDGWAYGCHNVALLQINGLTVSQSYQFSRLNLSQLNHTTLTFLPTFLNWVQAFPAVVNMSGTTTTTYYRRGIEGDTDGAQSHEGTDYIWIRVVGAGGATTDTYLPVTMANFVAAWQTAAILSFPTKGFAATLHTADPGTGGNMLRNDFLNGSLWVGYLRGAGLAYDSTGWNSGLDGALGTIKGQFLIDSLDWYPICGDAFGYTDSSYSDPLKVASGTILRGSSIGLVEQINSKPTVGVSVTVKKTGASDAAGSGTTDAYGQYRNSDAGTGLVYGKGGTSYDTTASTLHTPHPVLTRLFNARYRHRASFRDTTLTSSPRCLEIDSRRGWLHIGVGNTIVTLHFPSYALAFASTAYSVDIWRVLRYEMRSGTLSMLGLNTASSVQTFSLWTSQDGGLTASKVITVVANSAVLEKDSETGRQFILYENDHSGFADAHTVYMILTTDNWLTTTGPTAVQYGGVNLQAVLIDSSQDGRANARMTLLCTIAGNSVILESTDKGLTWSLDYTF